MATFDDLVRFFDAVERDVFGRRAMERLASISKDIIYKRTKSGKALGVGRLASLSQSYINRREYTGVPGAFGAPSRSNLTYTGQLLESFETEGRNGSFSVIIPNTQRKKPPSKPGQRFGDGNDKKTNSEIADIVAKNGRPFFGLKKDEGNILAKEVETGIRRVLNRFL